MDKCAFLFSGQGAQRVGMGADLYEGSPAARGVFDRAKEVLGIDLGRLCFEGPAGELDRTDISQPAIFVTSLAAFEAYRESGGDADRHCAWAAGLSLGEYTALTFAGAIGFEDGLRLVALRGRYMQEACESSRGGMLALLGATMESAEALCRDAAGSGHLNVANVNAPGQIVISGDAAAIDAAQAAAGRHGVRRAQKLAVAGAFHSKLMTPAAERLRERLDEVRIERPRLPVVSNVTARPATEPDEIRTNLSRQVVSSVLWADSMKYIVGNGVTTFLEFGPGNVLTGLVRRVADGVATVNVNSMESIQSASLGRTQ